MNSKIISVVAVLVVFNFISVQCHHGVWKATRANLCDEQYDLETRKEAGKCAIESGIYFGNPELANIFSACDKKYQAIDDISKGMPKSCKEHKDNGGPITTCFLRSLNPAKVPADVMNQFRKHIDSECFKGFKAVEDNASK